MPEIQPFCGLRYNKKAIKNIESVVAPPYDVINTTMQKELYRISPHNYVRLILGKEYTSDDALRNRYTRARHLLDQ